MIDPTAKHQVSVAINDIKMPKKRARAGQKRAAEELPPLYLNIKKEEDDDGYVQIEPIEECDLPAEYESIVCEPPRTVILHDNDVNKAAFESEIGLVSELEFIKTEVDVDEVAINEFRAEIRKISCDVAPVLNAKAVMKKPPKVIKKKKRTSQPKKEMDPLNVMVNGKKMVKCPFCDFIKTTRDRSYVKQHMRSHTGVRPYKCNYCDKRFITTSSLNSHIKYNHPTQATYKCALCRLIFHKKKLFRSHELKCVKLRTFQCHLCKFQMERLYMYKVKEHMRRSHTGEKVFKCEYCSEKFLAKAGRSAHMQRHPEKLPYKCSICKRRQQTKEGWQKHNKICIARRRLECHLCGYSYPRFTIKGLKMHMRKHTGEKPFQCQFCQKYYPRPEALAQHIQRHRDLFKFKCAQCHRRFWNDVLRKQHEQKCRKRRYECYLCRFTRFGLSYSKFRRHMLTHIGEKYNKCKGCSDTFSTPDLLARHISDQHPHLLSLLCMICYRPFNTKSARDTHQAKCLKRRIECYVCHFSPRTMQQLRAHMTRSHTGEKKFHCHLCPRKFGIKNNLDNHINSHTMKSLVQCQYCSKKFSHIKYKKKHEFRCKQVFECYLCKEILPSFAILHGVHIRKHLGARPYDCTHCPKKFTSIRCYKLHVIAQHLSAYRFQCNMCNGNIKNNKDVMSHQRACMKPIRQSQGIIYFKCSLCGLGLARVPELRKHLLAAECKKHPKKST